MQIKPSPEECTDEALSPAHLLSRKSATDRRLRRHRRHCVSRSSGPDTSEWTQTHSCCRRQAVERWGDAWPSHAGCAALAPFNVRYRRQSLCRSGEPGRSATAFLMDFTAATATVPVAKRSRCTATWTTCGRKQQWRIQPQPSSTSHRKTPRARYRALARLSFRSDIWLGYQRRGRSGAPRRHPRAAIRVRAAC